MKKSLIAAAVAVSLSAPAMAQVSISGFFNASYDQFSVSQQNAARVGAKNENRITDNSSRILFNVSEDLGGGMRAIGQFDLRVAMDAMQPINPTTAAAAATGAPTPPVNVINGGNNHVGLQTNLGTFRFGRQDIQYTENALFMPVGLATIASHAGFFHSVGARAMTGATRTANLAWWVSPRWNGTQLTLGYSTNPGGNSSNPTQGENDLAKVGDGARAGSGTWIKLDSAIGSSLNIVYSQVDLKHDYTGLTQAAGGGGAAATGLAAADFGRAWTGTAMADESGKVLTGKYNLGGGWNVGAGLSRNKTTVVITGVATTQNGTQFGLGYTTGAHQVGLGYTTLGDRKTGGANQVETGGKLWTLGYGYNLSKRTQLHASYVSLDNETNANFGLFYNASTVMANAAALNGERHTAYSLGIRHSF
jgi:predicted porin